MAHKILSEARVRQRARSSQRLFVLPWDLSRSMRDQLRFSIGEAFMPMSKRTPFPYRARAVQPQADPQDFKAVSDLRASLF